MLRVYQGSGPTDAWLVRDWLARNDIEAQVRGQHLLSLVGDVPLAWPSVWVDERDTERAKAAIAVFEGPQLVHPDWKCVCGESNGPVFAACWSCGVDRS